MNVLKTLAQYTRVETNKFWQKSTARVVLILLFLGPIVGEILLLSISELDAVFPRVTHFLFAGDIVLFITLATVVVSVLALGNDYELGTVHTILSRGITRSHFILSKIIATVGATLINASAYMAGGILSTFIVHITHSDIPLLEAAGSDILWRILGSVLVIGLVGFISSGVVMLALVLGRSSWLGMLAGLGYFMFDFSIGGLGLIQAFGLERIYRYAFTYYALSILEQFFPPDPHLGLPRAWSQEGLAGVSEAWVILFLYGAILTLASMTIFRRQDLLAKR